MILVLRRAGAILLVAAAAAVAQVPQFREHTITTGLSMGYQLVVTDVNRDGRPDLIAVDERGTELAWYENPGWQRHVIIAGVPRTINVNASDIDRDGIPEIAILYGFETRPDKSAGIVGLLHHDGDVTRPWKLREIDRVPTAHRVRWANLDGRGKHAMIMGPLVGLTSEPPAYNANVPIYMYTGPDWKRRLLTGEPRGILHSIYPVDWDGDGRDELLTASFLGLRLFRSAGGTGPWRSTEVAAGDPSPCPKCGSSEVTRGHLGKRPFLAAIEPWHGDKVVVYTESRPVWTRTVIDESFTNGHALAAGDTDADGKDEIVAGYRGSGYQLYLYRAVDGTGKQWRREVLDAGGIAAADCKIEDLNGDRRPDVVCIGASTHNIKWYENAGRP